MKQIVILIFLTIVMSASVFASSSASYIISIEAFGGGGTFEATSTNFKVHGLMLDKAYAIPTSTNFQFHEGVLLATGIQAVVLAPIVTSISPSSGNNTGTVEVTINGANFLAGASASLELSSQYISGESIVIVNSGKITCIFDLNGRTTGKWSVVVCNTDGRSGSLSGAFDITVPSGKLKVIGRPINYPNPFDPDRKTTTIKYVLSRDASITLNIYNINGQKVWQQVFFPGSMGGQAGVNTVTWDGHNSFAQSLPNGIYVFQIASGTSSGGETLATGKIAIFR